MEEEYTPTRHIGDEQIAVISRRPCNRGWIYVAACHGCGETSQTFNFAAATGFLFKHWRNCQEVAE